MELERTAVIMAGGIGKRLWPISTPELPKQFLKLLSAERTMIQLTAARIQKIIKPQNIFVVTSELYKDLTHEQLPNIPKENILTEPCSRNTAPCIALAVREIKKRFGNALVVVLPADHSITNENSFTQNIEQAFNKAQDDCLVTIGIVPTRPEINYGYIKINTQNGVSVHIQKAERFVEKPDFKTASQIYKTGECFWNSGIFIWQNKVINGCFEKYAPDIAEFIRTGKDFENLRNISIDYAVMQKTDNIYMLPTNFDWEDVGSLPALERMGLFHLKHLQTK